MDHSLNNSTNSYIIHLDQKKGIIMQFTELVSQQGLLIFPQKKHFSSFIQDDLVRLAYTVYCCNILLYKEECLIDTK